MDNFNLDELMDLAEAYVGPMIDVIYRRLMDRDFALEDPEIVMLLTALINILGHDNRGDRATEVLLMAAYGEREQTKLDGFRNFRTSKRRKKKKQRNDQREEFKTQNCFMCVMKTQVRN